MIRHHSIFLDNLHVVELAQPWAKETPQHVKLQFTAIDQENNKER